jgi:phage terminase large subunit-like protein
VQIARLFDLHAVWNYAVFGVETNCFQQLLLLPIEEERARRRAAKQPWQVAIREVHHGQAKEMRIAALEPLAANGWVRFDAALPELLWQQLEAFPRSEHDDALDALEGVLSILRTMKMETSSASPRKSIKRLANF